jgi:hypothetical protein
MCGRISTWNYGKRTEAANPLYGEKGHFRKVTITLPPDAYERLISESARRKIAGEPNHLLSALRSALLREAVHDYMPLLGNMTEEAQGGTPDD